MSLPRAAHEFRSSRGSPTSPPVPVRVPPPAAYGISVPGAPALRSRRTPPPPPPSAAPAGAPSPFATYAPPAPLPPAIQYASAPPTELRFTVRRLRRPAGRLRSPPASQFGAPAPEPVRRAAGLPMARPPGRPSPPKKQGSRLWAKIVAGLVVGARRARRPAAVSTSRATAHHVDQLPSERFSGATRTPSPQPQAVAAARSPGRSRTVHAQHHGISRRASTVIRPALDRRRHGRHPGQLGSCSASRLAQLDASAAAASVPPR